MAKKTAKPPSPATPPAGRVLRTNAEIADWLFRLDRRRKLARVARYEAACAEILRQPETDPRRPYVDRMQRLLAAARGNLERGHPADWQMAEFEALGSRMNRLFLEPLARHAKIMRQGKPKRSFSALRRVLETYHAEHDGAKFPAVWDHLIALADGEDKTIQEVLDGTAGCHPGSHVHWVTARQVQHATSDAAIMKLLRRIRQARPTGSA
jgi:hypothetical protein